MRVLDIAVLVVPYFVGLQALATGEAIYPPAEVLDVSLPSRIACHIRVELLSVAFNGDHRLRVGKINEVATNRKLGIQDRACAACFEDLVEVLPGQGGCRPPIGLPITAQNFSKNPLQVIEFASEKT